MFKKVFLIISTLSVFFLISACGHHSSNTQSKTQSEKTTAQSQNPYLSANFKAFENGVTNQSLIKSIENSISGYKKAVEKTTKEGNDYIAKIKSEIESNIQQGESVINQQEKLYNQNCQNISSKKQNDQCQSIKANIFNAKQSVKKLKIELHNQIGQIKTQMKNNLEKLKVQLLNNINKERHNEGLEKVNPFKK